MVKKGERVGPWLLGRELGYGGMGSVHEATDDAGRRVALKLLASGSEPELVARLVREIQALAAVHDPHVVGYVDADPHAKTPWLAMRLIDGDSLAHELEERRRAHGAAAFPHPQAGELALQIARGLAAAHEKGLVHRDLKPANVMITRARRAVIVDFGLARMSQSSTLTGVGSLLGSLINVPPEHLAGGRAGASGDVYQWGLVVHELLTGGLPFPHLDPMDAVHARVVTQPPAPAVPDPLAHLARVVAESLAPDPIARPGDGEALVRRLESLV